MKYIFVSLFILLGASNKMPDNTNWVTHEHRSDPKIHVIIKSPLKVSDRKISKTMNFYINIRNQFDLFEDVKCRPHGILNIFIISEKAINNSIYFEKGSSSPDKVIFGRYFKEVNDLYITPEFFRVPEFFAHELAHYFYDACGFTFENDMAEEKRTYKFQNFYEVQ